MVKNVQQHCELLPCVRLRSKMHDLCPKCTMCVCSCKKRHDVQFGIPKNAQLFIVRYLVQFGVPKKRTTVYSTFFSTVWRSKKRTTVHSTLFGTLWRSEKTYNCSQQQIRTVWLQACTKNRLKWTKKRTTSRRKGLGECSRLWRKAGYRAAEDGPARIQMSSIAAIQSDCYTCVYIKRERAKKESYSSYLEELLGFCC